MKTYDTIDYRLRVRKFVERNMIKESCQRLYYFDHLERYRYIGFGSLYFVDFKLFHRELGIKDMISIEYEPNINNQYRFEFNKPYDFIEMNFKKSTEALNEIKFDKKSITWLDYDENLKTYMFDDLNILLDNIIPGSIFIISLNTSINGEKTSELVIELSRLQEELKRLTKNFEMISTEEMEYSRELLSSLNREISKITNARVNRTHLRSLTKDFQQKLVNYSNIQSGINNSLSENSKINLIIKKIIELLKNKDKCREKNLRVKQFLKDYSGYLTRQQYREKDLSNKNSHIIIKEMFDTEINKTLKHINNTKTENEKLIYRQLYYFTYKDNASMMTFGGIIYEKEDEDIYNRCCFENLDYIKSGNEEYLINIPRLTEKEMNYYNNEIFSNNQTVTQDSLEESDFDKERILYKKVYRYLPHFTNVDNL